MRKNKKRINKYFFDNTAGSHGWVRGNRLEDTTQEIDGVSYTFDTNGVCTNCN